jgi:hypothetical protein
MMRIATQPEQPRMSPGPKNQSCKCPYCKERNNFRQESIGTITECRGCGRKFRFRTLHA